MPRKHTSLPGGVSNPCLPSDTLRYEPLCYQGFVSVFLIFVIIRDMERNKMVERKQNAKKTYFSTRRGIEPLSPE